LGAFLFCHEHAKEISTSPPTNKQLAATPKTSTPTHTHNTKTAGEIVMWNDDSRPNPDPAKYAPPADLGPVTAVSAGPQHACAIASGTSACVCWAFDPVNGPLVTPPPSLGPVTALSVGNLFTCVLTQAGGVVCFGDNTSSQTAVPPGLEAGATAVSAGYDHACALAADGKPVCWGGNHFGQATPPSNLTGLKQIEAGVFFTAALTAHGYVVIWGDQFVKHSTYCPMTPPIAIQGTVIKLSATKFDNNYYGLCVVTKTGRAGCAGCTQNDWDLGGWPMGAALSADVGLNMIYFILASGNDVAHWNFDFDVEPRGIPELSAVVQVAPAADGVIYALKA
jgi:hypothetical protein